MMQHLICGVDVETTGLDPKEDFVTEIGAALFDPHTWEALATFSTFVKIPIELPQEIVKLTGITDEMLMHAPPPDEAIRKFWKFADKATVFMAHNAEFDKSFLTKIMDEAGASSALPWYCSKSDVPTHQGKICTKLSHLALDYGLSVDGSKLHRALDDVRLMGRMLSATGLQFSEIKVWADEPTIYLQANVTYDQKELAKAAGFSWEKCAGTYAPVFPKKWVKKIKQSQLAAEKEKDVGFKRTEITPR